MMMMVGEKGMQGGRRDALQSYFSHLKSDHGGYYGQCITFKTLRLILLNQRSRIFSKWCSSWWNQCLFKAPETLDFSLTTTESRSQWFLERFFCILKERFSPWKVLQPGPTESHMNDNNLKQQLQLVTRLVIESARQNVHTIPGHGLVWSTIFMIWQKSRKKWKQFCDFYFFCLGHNYPTHLCCGRWLSCSILFLNVNKQTKKWFCHSAYIRGLLIISGLGTRSDVNTTMYIRWMLQSKPSISSLIVVASPFKTPDIKYSPNKMMNEI